MRKDKDREDKEEEEEEEDAAGHRPYGSFWETDVRICISAIHLPRKSRKT